MESSLPFPAVCSQDRSVTFLKLWALSHLPIPPMDFHPSQIGWMFLFIQSSYIPSYHLCDARGALFFLLKLPPSHHTASPSTPYSMCSEAASLACHQYQPFSPLTFSLSSLPYFSTSPLTTVYHAGFLLVYFSYHLSLQTECKLNVCRENIFEFPEFRYMLLNILEQVPIFLNIFYVTNNYNKEIRANLNEQIILYCGTIKSKTMLIYFL